MRVTLIGHRGWVCNPQKCSIFERLGGDGYLVHCFIRCIKSAIVRSSDNAQDMNLGICSSMCPAVDLNDFACCEGTLTFALCSSNGLCAHANSVSSQCIPLS